MRTIALQGRGYGVLHRHRTAQTSVRQLSDRCRHVVQLRRSTDGQPAGSPAWREERLRQTGERDHGPIRREAPERRNRTVVSELRVHLVRQNRQPMPLGEREERLANRRGIAAASRIVR